MQITPPFGYREIVPLQKTQGVKLPAPGKVPEFCASTNAMPISFSEFRVAGHDYPLVFASGDSGKTFAAVAVVGLANGENLFARDGTWVPDMYVPAYVRRYPFCRVEARQAGGGWGQPLADVRLYGYGVCLHHLFAYFADGRQPIRLVFGVACANIGR